jgi:hypothetical protein
VILEEFAILRGYINQVNLSNKFTVTRIHSRNFKESCWFESKIDTSEKEGILIRNSNNNFNKSPPFDAAHPRKPKWFSLKVLFIIDSYYKNFKLSYRVLPLSTLLPATSTDTSVHCIVILRAEMCIEVAVGHLTVL